MPIMTDTPEDVGVAVKYETFSDTEYIILRSVLTDDILDAARELAGKGGKFKPSAFTAELFRLMTIDYNILDQKGQPWILNEKNLGTVASVFKQWWGAEIDKQNGSVAPEATITIKGVEIPFRQTIGVLG